MTEKCDVPYDTISTTSVSSQSLFNKCCCCIPLRTGCFILGYLNLVLNCFQTLALIAITAFVGAVTHGFDHFDSARGEYVVNGSTEPFAQTTDTPADNPDQPMLTQLGFIMAVLLIANISWIVINIACLVGLHKKNPGPIRVYVGFATARLMLSFAGFLYLVMNNRAPTQTVVSHCFDIGLTAYFIMVYYVYANRLEKEREIAQQAPINGLVYPTKLDKTHFVA